MSTEFKRWSFEKRQWYRIKPLHRSAPTQHRARCEARGGKSHVEVLHKGKEFVIGWHYMLIKTAATLPCRQTVISILHTSYYREIIIVRVYYKRKENVLGIFFFFHFHTFYLWSLYLYLPQSGMGCGVCECLSLKACDKLTFLLKSLNTCYKKFLHTCMLWSNLLHSFS